jgi:hypothetical protein
MAGSGCGASERNTCKERHKLGGSQDPWTPPPGIPCSSGRIYFDDDVLGNTPVRHRGPERGSAGTRIQLRHYSAGTFVTSTTTPQLKALRPYRGYSAINSVETWFNSDYNSLQLSAEKRFANSSLLNASYTWSKNLTDNRSDNASAPQNTYNRRAEYGLASSIDATYSASTTYSSSRQGHGPHSLDRRRMAALRHHAIWFRGALQRYLVAGHRPRGPGIPRTERRGTAARLAVQSQQECAALAPISGSTRIASPMCPPARTVPATPTAV